MRSTNATYDLFVLALHDSNQSHIVKDYLHQPVPEPGAETQEHLQKVLPLRDTPIKDEAPKIAAVDKIGKLYKG